MRAHTVVFGAGYIDMQAYMEPLVKDWRAATGGADCHVPSR